MTEALSIQFKSRPRRGPGTDREGPPLNVRHQNDNALGWPAVSTFPIAYLRDEAVGVVRMIVNLRLTKVSAHFLQYLVKFQRTARPLPPALRRDPDNFQPCIRKIVRQPGAHVSRRLIRFTKLFAHSESLPNRGIHVASTCVSIPSMPRIVLIPSLRGIHRLPPPMQHSYPPAQPPQPPRKPRSHPGRALRPPRQTGSET